MKKLGKKGAIEQLQPMVIALVAVGIVLAIGFLIIAEAQDQIVEVQNFNESAGNGTAAYNASVDVQSALADIPTVGWPLI